MAHESAYRHYRDFLKTYSKPNQCVLDVGGEGGEFKKITEYFHHTYTALNTGDAGDGVRVAAGKEYDWPIKSNQYDMVISSSTFEHIPMFWLTFNEMVRVCKKDGLIYLNCPSSGPTHWSLDCWRFKEDGMKSLAVWGKVRILESFEDSAENFDPTWRDCVGIFTK